MLFVSDKAKKNERLSELRRGYSHVVIPYQ